MPKSCLRMHSRCSRTPPARRLKTKTRRTRLLAAANTGQNILSGESYHPTLVPLAASFASWGAPEPVTDNVLRCLLINSKPQDHERLRRRDAELARLPQTVRSAYAKFGKTDARPSTNKSDCAGTAKKPHRCAPG